MSCHSYMHDKTSAIPRTAGVHVHSQTVATNKWGGALIGPDQREKNGVQLPVNV